MDLEQVMELLLARMDAHQAKADADRKADRDKRMNTRHEEMVAENEPERDVKTMACQDTMDAHLEEKKPTSVDRKPKVAQQDDVHKEDAETMLIR
jgi:peroxiredoxin family protein